jgi:hypothetical protein
MTRLRRSVWIVSLPLLLVGLVPTASGAVTGSPANRPRILQSPRAEIAANLLTAKDVFGNKTHPPTGHKAQPDGTCAVQLPAPRIRVNRDWSSHTIAPPPQGGFTVISVSGSAFNSRRTANTAVRMAYNSETKCVGPYGRFQRHFAHTTAYCTATRYGPDLMARDDICRFVRTTVRYTVEVAHYGSGTRQLLGSLTSLAVKKVYG